MESIVPYKEAFSKYIPEQYKNSEKLLSLVNTCLDQCDSLENAFFEILQALNLQDAIGPALDWLGAIVGVERIPGESDTSYRSRIVSGMNLKNLPSNEALRLVIKFLTGCDSVGLFPNWPAETYYVLDGSTDADLSVLEHENMTSGASLVRGTFLCMEPGEGGYIVNDDNGMPFVVDYVETMSIPDNVLRFTFSNPDYDPTVAGVGPHGTWTKVETSNQNEWDWTGTETDGEFNSAFETDSNDVNSTNWVYLRCLRWNIESDFSYMFYGCTALVSVSFHEMTGVTNLFCVFDNCENLKNVVLNGASNNKNAAMMFYNCYNLESVVMDTVGVLDSDDSYEYNLYSTFSYCEKLESVSISGLSAVKKLYNTFYHCVKLESIILDIPNAEKLEYTFNNCTKLKQVKLLNSGNINSFTYTFYYCGELENAPELDTSSTLEFIGVFYGCGKLKYVPNYDTSNCTTFEKAFFNCESLEHLPGFSTINLSSLNDVLNGCLALKDIPQWYYSNVENFDSAFYNCEALKEIPEWLDVSGARNTEKMFYGCVNIERGAVGIYNKLVKISPTTYQNCFTNCGVATVPGIGELCKIPTAWGGLGSLPENSLLFNFGDPNYNPNVTTTSNHGTWTSYSTGYSENPFNLWIWTYDNADWFHEFSRTETGGSYLSDYNNNPVDVVAHGELTSVKCFCRLFLYASALRYCCDLVIPDASGVSSGSYHGMNHMFSHCNHLEILPHIEVSNFLSMEGFASDCTRLKTLSPIKINSMVETSSRRAYQAFINCADVESGSYETYLALLEKLPDTSGQNVTGCFEDCGTYKLTGISDLLKIPSEWGGLANNLTENSVIVSFANSDFDPSTEMPIVSGSWSRVSDIANFNAWKFTSTGTDLSEVFKDKFIDAENLVYILGAETSNVVNVDHMLDGCTAVEGGALNLYGQMSTQVTPPTDHADTFFDCGTLTENGTVELLGISCHWGGNDLYLMLTDDYVGFMPDAEETDNFIEYIRMYQDLVAMFRNIETKRIYI